MPVVDAHPHNLEGFNWGEYFAGLAEHYIAQAAGAPRVGRRRRRTSPGGSAPAVNLRRRRVRPRIEGNRVMPYRRRYKTSWQLKSRAGRVRGRSVKAASRRRKTPYRKKSRRRTRGSHPISRVPLALPNSEIVRFRYRAEETIDPGLGAAALGKITITRWDPTRVKEPLFRPIGTAHTGERFPHGLSEYFSRYKQFATLACRATVRWVTDDRTFDNLRNVIRPYVGFRKMNEQRYTELQGNDFFVAKSRRLIDRGRQISCFDKKQMSTLSYHWKKHYGPGRTIDQQMHPTGQINSVLEGDDEMKGDGTVGTDNIQDDQLYFGVWAASPPGANALTWTYQIDMEYVVLFRDKITHGDTFHI